MTTRLREAAALALGLVVIAFAAERAATGPAVLDPRDFLEYWAAGAVNARGGDPYDPAALLAKQREADPERDGAVMMWNPPWSLALYMPVGALPVRWATLAWAALQVAATAVALDQLWRTYGGPSRLRWAPQVVGLTFAPVVWMVLFGQNTGLVLLGLAGFLRHRSTRPALAGAFAALTALKPHLLAPVGVLLVADAVTRRGRIALAAGVGVVGAALVAALAANPHVLEQYARAVAHPAPGAVPLSEWVLPVPSYWLRVGVGAGFWVQFAPCGLACLACLVARLRTGPRWDWAAAAPWVVWLSVLGAPYGGWVFDLTVLLAPVVPAVIRLVEARAWARGAALAAAHLGMTGLTLARPFSLPGLFWVAPAVLALWLAARAAPRTPTSAPPVRS